jgi:hypothetical protein
MRFLLKDFVQCIEIEAGIHSDHRWYRKTID